MRRTVTYIPEELFSLYVSREKIAKYTISKVIAEAALVQLATEAGASQAEIVRIRSIVRGSDPRGTAVERLGEPHERPDVALRSAKALAKQLRSARDTLAAERRLSGPALLVRERRKNPPKG